MFAFYRNRFDAPNASAAPKGNSTSTGSDATKAAGGSPHRELLSWLDIAFLWFGAAVVIDELWSGAQVAPAGLIVGLVLIIAGKLTGNLLLSLVSGMGAQTGMPTMILSRASFGVRGSLIPAICNILQLIGWTAYMLVVAVEALNLLFSRPFSPMEGAILKLALGAVTTLWAVGGSRYWKIANRIAVVLLLGLSVVMAATVFFNYSFAELAAVTPPAGNPPMIIFDFIVAMAVSWVPLAADYGRFATSRRAAVHGAYWGYFAGSTWMYVVGLLGGFAYLAANPGAPVSELAPNAVVLGAFKAMHWVFSGIVLVVISTITTTFLDIYSTAASALNIFPKANMAMLTIIGGILGTILAFVLDMHSYVPFLLLIGVVFLPMFAIVAVDFLIVKRRAIDSAELLNADGIYRYSGGFNTAAIISWLVGMAVSIWAEAPFWLTDLFGIKTWMPFILGKTIPSFIVSAVLYVLLMRVFYAKRRYNGLRTSEA